MPPALAAGLFCNCSRFYAYFGQNSYFKVITPQLKAFEKSSLSLLNRINEVKVL